MRESTYHGFFDDAAVFPPGLAPLDTAVAEHIRTFRHQVTSDFIGPLILPLAKVLEAVQLAKGETLGISVVLPTEQLLEATELISELSGVSPNTSVSAIEVKVGENPALGIEQAAAFKSRHQNIEVYVELTADAVNHDSLATLKTNGLSLKFRTGGIDAHFFPSAEQVIKVLTAAVETGLPFKLTAGLHRALRYTDSHTGFDHFGFLNIAAATAALQSGAPRERALSLLNSNDAEVVTAALAASDDWRDSFLSFGTCSLSEPTETLGEIGQLSLQTVQTF
ncbi:hypothetical protein [Corynebacterium sp. A21]|uniref:hypothetical protein n=1 Tax=Corynebacterium sp. A21 TaxID=3457318 RepID=UPI003FD33492